MTKLTIGCDPEFFLHDSVNFEYVSAHDKIPGTKEEPYKLKHGACQADGTAVEFNIDPASTAEEFDHNIHEVLSQIRKIIPKRYSFQYKSYIRYSSFVFKLIPEESKKLGCDPDFNAFELAPNPSPKIPDGTRTASGHIHFGWGENLDTSIGSDHFIDCAILARQMEEALANIGYLYDESPHNRLQYYGANAAFRPKKYGVEYRAPSCRWLSKKEYAPIMFEIAKKVYEDTVSGTIIKRGAYTGFYNKVYDIRYNKTDRKI